jgi:putative photosynthetic complex assembly protein 2
VVWWFATGIILFLDGLPPASFRWSMSAATLLLAAALYVLHTSSSDVSVRGAYTAFSCAIVVWGWLEMSFLMGLLTGPRRHACLERCSGWSHFVHAVQAIIYNELATLAGAATVTYCTWNAQNKIALWTYLILWSMRLSAKLNLFFGVPNLGENFLPAHLQYLRSFFRKRPMNFLFPISVSASTIGVAILVQRYLADGTPMATAKGVPSCHSQGLAPQRPSYQSSCLMRSAALSAAIINIMVGLAPPPVGNAAVATTVKFGTR